MGAAPGFDRAREVWRRVCIVARRFGTWFVVLVLVVTTGGHWVALQMCAWTGMLVRFSQEGPVREAISKTFDGQHPCRLCQLVRQGRAEDRAKEAVSVVLKFDLLAPAPCLSLLPEVEGRPGLGFRAAGFAPQRSHSPPVPPPRAA